MTDTAITHGLTRAIYVDGSSLMDFKDWLHAGRIKLKELRELLVTKVGTITDLMSKPVISMNSDHMTSPDMYRRHCEEAGFVVIDTAADGRREGADIITMIEHLDPRTVGEIAVLTCRDCVLDALLLKAREGIRVHMIAPARIDHMRRILLTKLTPEQLETGFSFFDASKYKDLLRDGCQESGAASLRSHSSRDVSTIKLVLSSKNSQHHRDLMSEVLKLQMKYGGLSVHKQEG